MFEFFYILRGDVKEVTDSVDLISSGRLFHCSRALPLLVFSHAQVKVHCLRSLSYVLDGMGLRGLTHKYIVLRSVLKVNCKI